ncbi:C-X-C motif chemokine 16 [Crotalus adamanteus]|uniref:C-X-C motif chemokine 16 n=1 Tax=Crotalus adamanteus TaxID=8729 RepID=A0AAW1B8I7_CROAD
MPPRPQWEGWSQAPPPPLSAPPRPGPWSRPASASLPGSGRERRWARQGGGVGNAQEPWAAPARLRTCWYVKRPGTRRPTASPGACGSSGGVGKPRAAPPAGRLSLSVSGREGRGGMAAAAAGERRGGSGSRLTFAPRRSPLVLLLLLLLLLPARPALGNEGGTAGSCRCERYRDEPPLVKRFADRLMAWERCRGLIRFIFPQKQVCGLDDAPWVLRLISLQAEKRKGADRLSSTSPAPLQPLSSLRSTRELPRETPPSQELPRETPPSQQMPKETPPSQQLPALTTTMAALALESVRSVVLPRNGAAAEVSPTQLAQEDGVPGWPYQTTVLSALGIVLLLVIAGLLCWWRPPRRRRRAALSSEQQVCMLQRPGEGATCSLGAHAAAASGAARPLSGISQGILSTSCSGATLAGSQMETEGRESRPPPPPEDPAQDGREGWRTGEKKGGEQPVKEGGCFQRISRLPESFWERGSRGSFGVGEEDCLAFQGLKPAGACERRADFCAFRPNFRGAPASRGAVRGKQPP